jgi:YidC/Oxa1 family membrane protein insertase
MQQLQPLIKEINKKYETKKGERLPPEKSQAKQAEVMRLYSEYSINPAASCLPILIQLPLFFAVYSAVRGALGDPDPLIRHLSASWHVFVQAATGSSTTSVISDDPFPFFWLKSLSNPDPLFILPVLMVIFQFCTQKMAIPRGGGADDQQRRINGIMQWTPLIFGFTALNFPAGPVVYWVTTSVFSVIQQFFITGWGSLADIPGLGFLPAKQLKTVELKKREIPEGQAPRKGLMERLQENQERIQSEQLAKRGSEGSESKSRALPPTRTSAKLGSAETAGSADGSRDDAWEDEEASSNESPAKTSSSVRRTTATGNKPTSSGSRESNVANAYNQLNRRPPKKSGNGNGGGSSKSSNDNGNSDSANRRKR